MMSLANRDKTTQFIDTIKRPNLALGLPRFPVAYPCGVAGPYGVAAVSVAPVERPLSVPVKGSGAFLWALRQLEPPCSAVLALAVPPFALAEEAIGIDCTYLAAPAFRG